MPGTTTYITYTILLSDPVAAANAQALYPDGIQMAPAVAAVLFNAPIGGQTPGGALILPAITVPTGQGTLPSYSVETGIYPGTGYTDQYGTYYPPITYYWVGYFLFQGSAPPPGPPPPPPPNPVGVRRFIEGFEVPVLGSGGSGGLRCSRDASRLPEGLGYAYRAANNENCTHNLSPQPPFSYERFYIRLRALPSGGNDMVWYCTGNGEAGPSLHLDVTTGGTLCLYNQGSGGAPGTLLFQSTALALGAWTRVDLQYHYSTGALVAGTAQIAINGVSLGVPVGIPNGQPGLGTIQLQASSSIGNKLASTHGLECDIDDWVNSDFLDVTTGSHIACVRATGFDPSSSAAWVGDWRQLLPLPGEASTAADSLVSSTASTVLAVTTDYTDQQQGCAALQVSVYVNAEVGGGNGALGWLLSGTPTTQAVALFSSTWNQALYTVGGNTIPPLMPLGLTFSKNAGAGAVKVSTLCASAEYVGVFGPEDAPSGVTAPAPSALGTHNAPYFSAGSSLVPTDPFASGVSPGGTNVLVLTGLYTGNNLGQDVLSQIPAHWWWVRPLSGDTDGVWWWSSMISATGRRATSLGMKPIRMPQALLTPAGVATLRVAGQDTQGNASAVSYRWVCVCDPSHRFVLNGAFAHAVGLASAVNALVDPLFVPDAAFLLVEDLTAGIAPYFKGVGHTGTTASPVNATQVATALALGPAAALTSYAAVHNQNNIPQTAYSAWRRQDGTGSALRICDFTTYVGNGAGGTRVIPVNLGGQTPFFALVTPHTAASYFRDPSHTGTTSSQIDGTADPATGITAFGANSVTVGTDLNVTSVVYDVFVLMAFNGTFPPPPPPPGPCLPGGPTITITPNPLPNGTLGVAYSQQLTATGGTAPYTWSMASGTLPPGLTLSSSGLLSGIPTEPGCYGFIIRVTDANGYCGFLGTGIDDLGIASGPTCGVICGTPPLPVAINDTVGVTYSYQFVATGGTPPYTWSAPFNQVPPGLMLSASGLLSGTPTLSGTFTFVVRATDSARCYGDLQVTLVIAQRACPPITVGPAILAPMQVGTTYRQPMVASGSVATPYTFALTLGALPPGLSLSLAGVISGVPTLAGLYTFTVTATDLNGCPGVAPYAEFLVTGAGCPPLTIAPPPVAHVGTFYTWPLLVTGGVAPYTFSVIAGALPPGLMLSSSGLISGIPTATAPPCTIRVLDANNCPGTITLTLAPRPGVGPCTQVPGPPPPPPAPRVCP